MADSDVSVTHLQGDRWVIALSGEHDLSTAPQLEAAFASVFATGTALVVDLSQASFIDSTVLRSLIDAQHRVSQTAGEQLAIVAPEGSVAACVLDLAGLQGLLPVYEDKAAALAGFA